MKKRIKELDAVLNIITSLDMKRENALPVIPKRYIDIQLKRSGIDITSSHLTAILSKLMMDKYISNDREMVKGMKQSFYIYGEVSHDDKTGITVQHIDPDTTNLDDIKEDLYWATWEGIYFSEDNGYKQFYNDKKRESLLKPIREWLPIGLTIIGLYIAYSINNGKLEKVKQEINHRIDSLKSCTRLKQDSLHILHVRLDSCLKTHQPKTDSLK